MGKHMKSCRAMETTHELIQNPNVIHSAIRSLIMKTGNNWKYTATIESLQR
jgi:hypothetical protein